MYTSVCMYCVIRGELENLWFLLGDSPDIVTTFQKGLMIRLCDFSPSPIEV